MRQVKHGLVSAGVEASVKAFLAANQTDAPATNGAAPTKTAPAAHRCIPVSFCHLIVLCVVRKIAALTLHKNSSAEFASHTPC